MDREQARPSTAVMPYYQSDFPLAEFADRRARVAEAIGRDALAIVAGAPASGASDVFRQSNEFYYLCGVEVPHAYLAIVGGQGRTNLYLPGHDAAHERSEGLILHADDPEQVRRLTGLDNVFPLDELANHLGSAAALYTPLAPAEGRQAYRSTLEHARRRALTDPWDQCPSTETVFAERLRTVCPCAKVNDLSPILDSLRLIKSPREIEHLRQAGRLSALGVVAAMRATRPGLSEYHLAAVAEYVYRSNGAQGVGYRPIVASGANIWNAHYFRNNAELRDGDWLLFDCAPDCGYYTSDIGRMWPVNGRYSAVQRELYGFIVSYHRSLLDRIRPGVTADQTMDEAAGAMAPVVEATSWSKPTYAQAARNALLFRGHLSHSVGMAVHDPGDYYAMPLEPGLVFSVDPQMWVPDERLYIRVEDTIALTADGIENLTSLVPLDLDEVEQAMSFDRASFFFND